MIADCRGSLSKRHEFYNNSPFVSAYLKYLFIHFVTHVNFGNL